MSQRELHLPNGYRENHPEDVGEDDLGYWADPEENRLRRARRYQDAVYRFAAGVTVPAGSVVIDIGCGTGLNLAHHFRGRNVRTVGVDQPSAIAMADLEFPDLEWIAADLREPGAWDALGALRPDLVICADVIEHVDDPLELLARLHRLIGANGRLVLSTPDRDRLEDQPALGPPRNPHHVREWAHAELASLVRACGFTIVSTHHALPRHFGLNVLDAKIVAWRALHGRAIPARRSCMIFELRSA